MLCFSVKLKRIKEYLFLNKKNIFLFFLREKPVFKKKVYVECARVRTRKIKNVDVASGTM